MKGICRYAVLVPALTSCASLTRMFSERKPRNFCPPHTTWVQSNPDVLRAMWCEGPGSMLHGPFVTYYPIGRLESHTDYEQGQMTAKLEWYENGQQKTEAHYLRGELNGQYRGWYPDGKLQKEAVYTCGFTQDERTYDEQGNVYRGYDWTTNPDVLHACEKPDSTNPRY